MKDNLMDKNKEWQEIKETIENEQPQNAIKMLTKAIYQHSEIINDQIQLMFDKCEQLKKNMPIEVRNKLNDIVSSNLAYLRLVDQYSK